MTSFAHQLAPANKSPTSTVNPHGRGNGQPGGQLDVGAGLSDAELIRHVQDCAAAAQLGGCFWLAMARVHHGRLAA